jgi:hypothetical protein
VGRDLPDIQGTTVQILLVFAASAAALGQRLYLRKDRFPAGGKKTAQARRPPKKRYIAGISDLDRAVKCALAMADTRPRA